MPHILLIEDEKINRITLTDLLEEAGYNVTAVDDGMAGIEQIEKRSWDVILTDLRLPGADGLELLKRSKEIAPNTPVLVMTAYATVKNAIECLQQGAFNYLTKPFDSSELMHHLKQASEMVQLDIQNKSLKSALAELQQDVNIIGDSEAVREVMTRAKAVADTDHTVLLEGASGTGKEVFADAIQQLSSRSEQPYIKVNCSALSETLFETEMFGHEKGAFTGAVRQVVGRFERSKGGTILLDDIDDLSLRLQTKLLRVIQEGEIERVGGTRVIPVDIRVIAATKVDLLPKVNAGEFREDLYYRLNVVKLIIPTLDERRMDIPALARHFLSKEAPEKTLAPETITYLSERSWPGNIRELEHLVQQLAIFSTGDIISLEDIPTGEPEHDAVTDSTGGQTISIQGSTLVEKIRSLEEQLIRNALDKHHGNQNKAAAELGIPRTTLRSKLGK